MEEHTLNETNSINESDGGPINTVELNTIVGSMVGGDTASLMLDGPEDRDAYLPGWGGGSNGTVAPMPEVRESDGQETSDATRPPTQGPKMVTVSF